MAHISFRDRILFSWKYTYLVARLIAVLFMTNCLYQHIAHAEPITLNPVVREVILQGQKVRVPVFPSFEMQPTRVVLTISMAGDLSDFQKKFPNVVNGIRKDDDCGDWIKLSRTRLFPHDRSARVYVHLDYKKWNCGYFLGKRIWKTIILEQSADITVQLTPAFDKNRIYLNSETISAMPDGILGQIIGGLGLEAMIKEEVNKALRKALRADNMTLIIPDQLRKYRPKINDVRFRDRGNGNLGLGIQGSISVNQNQLAGIFNQTIRPLRI